MSQATWFSDRLVMEREQQGLTQKEVARRAQVSNTSICQWESGARGLTLDSAFRWASALGFTVDLYRVENTPNK